MINIIRPDRPINEMRHPCKFCESMRQLQAEMLRKIGLMPRNKNIVMKPEAPVVKTAAWDNRK
jgi:hypothetical protein